MARAGAGAVRQGPKLRQAPGHALARAFVRVRSRVCVCARGAQGGGAALAMPRPAHAAPLHSQAGPSLLGPPRASTSRRWRSPYGASHGPAPIRARAAPARRRVTACGCARWAGGRLGRRGRGAAGHGGDGVDEDDGRRQPLRLLARQGHIGCVPARRVPAGRRVGRWSTSESAGPGKCLPSKPLGARTPVRACAAGPGPTYAGKSVQQPAGAGTVWPPAIEVFRPLILSGVTCTGTIHQSRRTT